MYMKLLYPFKINIASVETIFSSSAFILHEKVNHPLCLKEGKTLKKQH